MNTELASTLFERCASQEVYSLGVSRFWRDKTNKLTEYAQVLANIIDEKTNPLSGTSITNIDSFMIISNNDAVKLSDVVTAAQNDSRVLSISRTYYTIDQLVEKLNESIQNSDILASALEAVATQAESSDMGIAQVQAKINAMSDASGYKASVISNLMSVISNKNLDVVDKCSIITQIYAGNTMEDASTDQQVIDQINSYSTSGVFTGINPIMGASVEVWNGITSVTTWQEIVASIGHPIKAAVTGVRAAWNWIKNNREKVMDAARKTAEFVGASTRDVTMNQFDSNSNYDYSFDNCCLRAKLTSINQWDAVIDFLNNQGVSLTHAAANRLYAKMSHGTTLEFDFPFGNVYLTCNRVSASNYEWYFTVKLKPANIGSYLNAQFSPSLDFGNTGWEFFMGLNSLTDDSVYTYIPTTVSHFDNYFMQCTLLGKALFVQFLRLYLTDSLDGIVDENAFWMQVLAQCALGQGLNKTISVSLDHTTDDPTNEDFMTILSYISDQTNDIYDFDNTQTNSYAFFAWVVGACIQTNELTKNGTFIPYTYVSCIRPGKFHIKTDKENINKVFFNTGVVIASVAAVALITTGVNMKRNLRSAAVQANVQASAYQDQLKNCLINGTPISDELKNQVYKSTAKAVRLNKLTGGFASVTTGLATWSNGSALSAGSQDSIALQELKSIITGSV